MNGHEGQPGTGSFSEYEEAQREGVPTGDDFIDGMAEWTRIQIQNDRELRLAESLDINQS